MKTCKKCGQSKPLDQFSKRSLSPDGLQLNCKACNKVNNKKFRTTINPSYYREYYHKNPEKIKALIAKSFSKLGCGVYGIFDKTNNVCLYIGSSMNLQRRIYDHKTTFNNIGQTYTLSSRILAEYLIDKGEIEFEIKVLEKCSIEEKIERENHYIAELKPICNVHHNTDNNGRVIY